VILIFVATTSAISIIQKSDSDIASYTYICIYLLLPLFYSKEQASHFKPSNKIPSFKTETAFFAAGAFGLWFLIANKCKQIERRE
jgi:hypothetical protein